MMHMNVRCADLVANGVISGDEADWVTSVRIPYNATGDQWLEKHRIDRLVTKALSDRVVSEVERESVIIQRGPQIVSDYINGPGGALQNQADGKMYDSKSQYYKAVRAAGCEVLGNDAPTVAAPMEAKMCENELKRDIAQAINQLGG